MNGVIDPIGASKKSGLMTNKGDTDRAMALAGRAIARLPTFLASALRGTPSWGR